MELLSANWFSRPVNQMSSRFQFLLPHSNAVRSKRHGCATWIIHASDQYHDGKGLDASRPTNLTARRHIIFVAQAMAVGASIISPKLAMGAEEKVKMYSNLEDARKAGDVLREEKEAAEGPILTSSSGIKYRELERGIGKPIVLGDLVSIYYTISRLNGYYLDSLGYGKEGKNDVGDTLTFQYGKGLVPEAIEGGMEGMQVGARRRILVTPQLGWVSPNLLPKPTSFFAERRLAERRTSQALLIEVELVKVKRNAG